jgi:hypothetical protein
MKSFAAILPFAFVTLFITPGAKADDCQVRQGSRVWLRANRPPGYPMIGQPYSYPTYFTVQDHATDRNYWGTWISGRYYVIKKGPALICAQF